MNLIHYVNALASAGKTYQMIREAHRLALQGECRAVQRSV
jgi:hypothetical protein